MRWERCGHMRATLASNGLSPGVPGGGLTVRCFTLVMLWGRAGPGGGRLTCDCSAMPGLQGASRLSSTLFGCCCWGKKPCAGPKRAQLCALPAWLIGLISDCGISFAPCMCNSRVWSIFVLLRLWVSLHPPANNTQPTDRPAHITDLHMRTHIPYCLTALASR